MVVLRMLRLACQPKLAEERVENRARRLERATGIEPFRRDFTWRATLGAGFTSGVPLTGCLSDAPEALIPIAAQPSAGRASHATPERSTPPSSLRPGRQPQRSAPED